MFKVNTHQRYLMREVLAAVLLVLLAFLALFSFFNFVDELRNVGRADYTAGRAALFVALGLPGLVYELIPIAALIGTLYAGQPFGTHGASCLRIGDIRSADDPVSRCSPAGSADLCLR